MRTNLLHHSAVSPMHSGVMMFCCCSLSNSSLNGFCSAYATCLRGNWYGLLFGFSCKENIPSKHPISLKMPSKSLCRCFFISLLALLSPSLLGPGRKYLTSLFFTDGVNALLLFEFKLLPVFE